MIHCMYCGTPYPRGYQWARDEDGNPYCSLECLCRAIDETVGEVKKD